MSEALIARIKSRCVECGDCLIWQGAMSRGGHPQIKIEGKVRYVRKVLWEAEHGQVPKGKQVANTCGTRGCVIHGEA